VGAHGGAWWHKTSGTLGWMELPTLRDGDLVMRPKRPGDVDALVAACQDPEIPRWTFVPSPYTRADAEHFLTISAQEAAAGSAVHLLAVDADDGSVLGSFSVMEIDREPGYGEIGYWVAAEARGRGIATRATQLLADWARSELGLTRIEILPHKDNGPSRRVAEKAGFRDTGALVGSPRGPDDERVFAVYVWER
jgi:RimJ/RimL family protein N-acetyltransferase